MFRLFQLIILDMTSYFKHIFQWQEKIHCNSFWNDSKKKWTYELSGGATKILSDCSFSGGSWDPGSPFSLWPPPTVTPLHRGEAGGAGRGLSPLPPELRNCWWIAAIVNQIKNVNSNRVLWSLNAKQLHVKHFLMLNCKNLIFVF